jgi:hypothetical protein
VSRFLRSATLTGDKVPWIEREARRAFTTFTAEYKTAKPANAPQA